MEKLVNHILEKLSTVLCLLFPYFRGVNSGSQKFDYLAKSKLLAEIWQNSFLVVIVNLTSR